MEKNHTWSVTVVIAVKNEAAIIDHCLWSLVNQTFTDFEVVLVDDNSSDDTVDRALRFSPYLNLKVLRNSTSRGQTQCLIDGVARAQGKYICRLDADDYFLPERIERGYKYLTENPNIGLVGSAILSKDQNHSNIWCGFTSSWLIKIVLPFSNQFRHSAVIFRSDVYNKVNGYSPSMYFAQDYDLWLRMLRITKAVNEKEVLVVRNIRRNGVGSQNSLARYTFVLKALAEQRNTKSGYSMLATAASVYFGLKSWLHKCVLTLKNL